MVDPLQYHLYDTHGTGKRLAAIPPGILTTMRLVVAGLISMIFLGVTLELFGFSAFELKQLGTIVAGFACAELIVHFVYQISYPATPPKQYRLTLAGGWYILLKLAIVTITGLGALALLTFGIPTYSYAGIIAGIVGVVTAEIVAYVQLRLDYSQPAFARRRHRRR